MNLIPRLTALAAFCGLLTSGCHPRDGRSEVREHVLMHTSFEELPYTSREPIPSLTTVKAHTGQTALFVDGSHEFSATFRKKLVGSPGTELEFAL